jgi:hypothetical protein
MVGNKTSYSENELESDTGNQRLSNLILGGPASGSEAMVFDDYDYIYINFIGMLGAPYVGPDEQWDTIYFQTNSIFYLPESAADSNRMPDDNVETSMYNDFWNAGPRYVSSEADLNLPPEFLSYDENGYPTDWHLSLSSPLIDMGDPTVLDPDGSRADMGPYGGPDGDKWDLDWDGYPNYFWPGTIHDAPLGFYEEDYDCDDRDPWVFLCPKD